MEICDYAEIFDLKLVIECRGNHYYFTPYYRGENALMSEEGVRALLSLYDGRKTKSQRGKVFEFEGNFEHEFQEFSKMGYSTNSVISFDGKVLKSYRKVGSREPDLILSLPEIASRVLGWGKYDGKYIQIVTEKIEGEDVGNLFYRSYRNFMENGEFQDPGVEKVARTVSIMHEKLEKFGVEKISRKDIERWRNYVKNLANRGNVFVDVNSLFSGMEGKENIVTHQDLHLSQMLLNGEKIIIVDFEGEPLRENQNEKLQPIRDVSTLARAVDYITEGEWNDWERRIVEKLYNEYRRFSRYSFDMVDYADWMIEKAIYEINYEMKYRPEMVQIPKRGLENAMKFKEGLK